MRRRSLLTLLGGAAAAWPLGAEAQQVRRIGMLMSGPEDDPVTRDGVSAFLQAFEKAGWIAGRNVQIDYRWSSGLPERIRAYAAELVALHSDVIVTSSNQVTAIVRDETSSIPIVFASANDPFETGLVGNMAHPGGNVTGFVLFEIAIGGKWVQLLKEAAPHLTQLAVLYTPDSPISASWTSLIVSAGNSLGLRMIPAPARDTAEIERAVNTFTGVANTGLVVLLNPLLNANSHRIVALATQHRIPAIYPSRRYMSDGGLMTYTVNFVDLYPRAASYVDRILRGEKPGDLPVQAPTKYELLVNLKAAKTIGLTIPESFLVRADEVIE